VVDCGHGGVLCSSTVTCRVVVRVAQFVSQRRSELPRSYLRPRHAVADLGLEGEGGLKGLESCPTGAPVKYLEAMFRDASEAERRRYQVTLLLLLAGVTSSLGTTMAVWVTRSETCSYHV